MKYDFKKLEIIRFLYSIYIPKIIDNDPSSPIMIKPSLMKPLIYMILIISY